MKENINVNNLKELYTETDSTKRPRDILIDGKSIFELPKTPAQQETIRTALRLVGDYLHGYGVQHNTFDGSRIVFLPQKNAFVAAEYHDLDYVALSEQSEGDLCRLVHELIHAQSAEWRNYSEEELEAFLEDSSRGAKSGFHTVWRNDPEGRIRVNFKSLNEGITEKIARDIVGSHAEELDRLKPLFTGRMEEKLAEAEEIFRTETLPVKKIEIEKEKERIDEEIQEEIQDFERQISEIDEELATSNDPELTDILLKFKKSIISHHEYMVDMYKHGKQYQDERIEMAERIHEITLQDIRRDYSFSMQDKITYNFEIVVLEKILNGMATYVCNKDPNLDYDYERQKIWHDLQQAYLTGNTMYLRTVERALGPGFLRWYNDFSPLATSAEQEEFLKKLDERIINQ